MLEFLKKIEPFINILVSIPPICKKIALIYSVVVVLFNGSCAYYLTHTSSENTAETLDRLSRDNLTPKEQLNELSNYYDQQGDLMIETANLYK